MSLFLELHEEVRRVGGGAGYSVIVDSVTMYTGREEADTEHLHEANVGVFPNWESAAKAIERVTTIPAKDVSVSGQEIHIRGIVDEQGIYQGDDAEFLKHKARAYKADVVVSIRLAEVRKPDFNDLVQVVGA